MSDILLKSTAINVLDPGTPGTPSTPPTPPYCIDVTNVVQSTQILVVPDKDGGFEFLQVTGPPVEVIEHQCFPGGSGSAGTPGAPAKFESNYLVGWNAGATSVDTLAADGIYQFGFNAGAVGVVTGFNSNNQGTSYQEIQYGIYGASGTFQVMELGMAMTSPTAFVHTDVFSIVRLGGLVMYFQNNTLVYTSTVYSYGTIFVDASLYFGGDEVVQ